MVGITLQRRRGALQQLRAYLSLSLSLSLHHLSLSLHHLSLSLSLSLQQLRAYHGAARTSRATREIGRERRKFRLPAFVDCAEFF